MLYSALTSEREGLYSTVGNTINSVLSVFVPTDSSSTEGSESEKPRNTEFDRIAAEGRYTGRVPSTSMIAKAIAYSNQNADADVNITKLDGLGTNKEK